MVVLDTMVIVTINIGMDESTRLMIKILFITAFQFLTKGAPCCGGARYHGHRHYKHIMSLVLSYAYVYSDDDYRGVAHSCCSYVTCNGF